MSAVAGRLRELRAVRRRTVRELAGLTQSALTAHVGPARNDNVRSILLSLAQDDDRRRVELGGILAALNWQPNPAQRTLAGLALSRGVLRAAIVGLGDEEFARPVSPKEWSVRQAVEHVMNNEQQFLADALYAVERLHDNSDLPAVRPVPGRGPGQLPPPTPGGLEAVLDALETARDEIIATLQFFTTEEFAAPVARGDLVTDVRSQLERRAGHEREHTGQVWKTLQAIRRSPSEAEMILGHAELSRGALEGMLMGLPDALFSSESGGGRMSVEQLLIEAEAQEEARVESVLRAVS